MAELQALFTPRPASPSLDPSHDPRAPEALRAAVGPSEEGKPPGRGVRWRVWMDHPLPSHPEPRGAVERGCRALLTLANLPWVCAWSLRCVQLCDPMDSSLPDSSVHGILQARILEWVSIPPPGDLPDPGIFLTQGLNPHFLCLLHWQVGSLPLAPPDMLLKQWFKHLHPELGK